MFRSIRKMPLLAALVGASFLGIGTQQARAGLLPNLKPVTAVGDEWRFSYDVDVGVKSVVNSGDFFTIYDFEGYIPGSNTQPAGWTFSSANVGTSADQTSPNDDANVINLTWSFVGSTPIHGPQANLSDFSAISTYNTLREDDFGSSIHRSDNGDIENNITRVDVPTGPLSTPDPPNDPGDPIDPVDPTVPEAPEPATMVLLGISLPLLSALGLIRRRRKAAAGK